MIIFNLYGVIGVVVSVAVTWLLDFLLKAASHLSDGACAVYDLQVACLVLGLFGLTFDRCEEKTLWRGYALNFNNTCMRAFNQKVDRNGVFYRPDRRLCMLLFPLALAPIFMQVGLLLFWPVASLIMDGKQNNLAFVGGLVTGIPVLIIWYYYSVRTHDRRNLPDLEILLTAGPSGTV